MIDFVKTFICVLIAVVLFLIQKVLSSRSAAWLGSIMPILTIVSAVVLIRYMDWELSFRTTFPFMLLFLMFVITWVSERGTIKKNRQKEDNNGIDN